MITKAHRYSYKEYGMIMEEPLVNEWTSVDIRCGNQNQQDLAAIHLMNSL